MLKQRNIADEDIDPGFSVSPEPMTVEEYLGGLLRGWEIPDASMRVFLHKRQVPSGTDVSELDDKTKDLLTADLYFWMSMPGKRGTTTDKDGDWSHSETGDESTMSDRAWFRTMAENIYAKYGEELPAAVNVVKIQGFGISQRRTPKW